MQIIVIARYPTIRAGLRSVLESGTDLSVITETDDPTTLPELLEDPGADAVLIDLVDDPPETLGLVRQHAVDGLLPPLVLLFGSATDALGGLRIPGASLLLRDASPLEIQSAVRAAVAGLVSMDPRVVDEIGEQLILDVDRAGIETSSDLVLSPRELEVLQRVARGLPNKTIATELGISEHTVKFHVGSIFQKLGVASRSEAVAVAARRGLFLL